MGTLKNVFYCLLILRGTNAQIEGVAPASCHQNVPNIPFLVFIPCLEDNGVTRPTSERLDDCDLLARAAVSLAVERVNQNKDILPNSSVTVVPLSVTLNTPETEQSASVSSVKVMQYHTINLEHSPSNNT